MMEVLNSLWFFYENKIKFGIFLFPFTEESGQKCLPRASVYLPERGREHLILDTVPNLYKRKSLPPASLSFENNECFESQISSA